METEDPEKQRTKTIWSSVGKEDLNKNMLPIVDVSCRISLCSKAFINNY